MASSRDLDILAWTMLGEAGGEGRDGMADVGHVILNRLETGKYGSSISDVALANKQFSTWNKGEGGNDPQGRYPKSSREFQQARQLAEQVVSGVIPGPPGKPLDYHTPDISPYWASSKNQYGTYVRNGHMYYPSHPVPPGEIPNVVASRTDTQRPGMVGNNERPTSALSAAYPTLNATPRLSPALDGIYAYNPPDMQKPQGARGLGALNNEYGTANVPLPQPRPSRAVAGFPTPLPTYQKGPEQRLPDIGSTSSPTGPGPTSLATVQDMYGRPSGIGQPPTTRTVASVPIPGPSNSVGSLPNFGGYLAQFGAPPPPVPTTAIPGPNAFPKGQERLVAGLYPAPPSVGTKLDVTPGFPMPRPRPLRSGVNVPMPTPRSQRPGAPLPRPPVGFPTALSQRPAQSQPLRVAVNGAGSYSGGGPSASSQSAPEPRYVLAATGKEVRPVQTSIYNPDTNQFEKRTVYR